MLTETEGKRWITKAPEEKLIRLRLIDTPRLLRSLLKYIHTKITERIPFDLFLRLLMGDEYARYELLWKYGYSLPIDKGKNPEFSVSKRNRYKILRTVANLIFEKLVPPIPRETWDRTEAPIHEYEIPALLFRQTPDGQLKITIHNLLTKIDPDWKKSLRSIEG